MMERALGRHAAPFQSAQPAPRLPWPIYTALGVLGALLPALGYFWALALWPLVLAFAWYERRSWGGVAALVAGALAFGSLSVVQARPDPLTPWHGAVVTLRGEWDGQFLTLRDPPARVVLSPRPAERRGEVSVRGRLLPPRERTVPGGFDQAAWLRSQGGLVALAPSAVLVGAEVRGAGEASGVKSRTQGWFERGWAGLSPEAEALLIGLELGDRSGLNELESQDGGSVRDDFTRAGLAHLLALSGQHVTLLVGALSLLLLRLPLPPATRFLLPAAFLVFYLAGLVQVSPSVTRAVLMGMVVAVALAFGRGRPEPLGLLALIATVTLLAFPLWVLTPGFQLSFLAVAGLTLVPGVMARLPQDWTRPGWRQYLTGGVAVTLLAQAATLPLVAGSFGVIPLAGLPANLLAAPLMTVLVPLGFLAGLLGPLGTVLTWPLEALAQVLLNLAHWFGRWPVLPWGAVGPGGYAAFALSALAGVAWLRGWIRPPVALGTWLLCALLTALPSRLDPPRQLVFLDVGQGDSTLIQAPGLRVLVDGGGTPHGDYDLSRTVIPALRSLGVSALDVVVATHSDTDHIEGLVGVLRELPVGELWIGQRDPDNELLAELLAVAKERGIPVREVRRGDYVQAGGVRLDVLWPEGRFWSTEPNENSVALGITAGEFRAALLGDLPAPLEHSLGLRRLDLLKAAHHGSRHSTSATLLAQTAPADAVISVGYNTFRHPSDEVLTRLDAAGVRVWRTDQQGSVIWPLP